MFTTLSGLIPPSAVCAKKYVEIPYTIDKHPYCCSSVIQPCPPKYQVSVASSSSTRVVGATREQRPSSDRESAALGLRLPLAARSVPGQVSAASSSSRIFTCGAVCDSSGYLKGPIEGRTWKTKRRNYHQDVMTAVMPDVELKFWKVFGAAGVRALTNQIAKLPKILQDLTWTWKIFKQINFIFP